jgi:hypothetical protein
MKKLLTNYYGRMPVVLNDVRFLDSSYREVFETFLNLMEANNTILYGCDVSNNGDGTYSVTAGAVVINSEVYLCEAHSFPCTNINEAYFVVSVDYDPEGSKTFGDNSVRDTYQLNKIVAEQHAVQPLNSINVNSAKYEFYTKSRVITEIDNAIANLIDGSPGALDTLNELAAALGDDPNYATTITNLLAGKEPTFSKNTAFNKNFAGSGVATTVSRSDHDHLEGWTVVTTFGTGFQAYTGNSAQRLRYRRFNNGKMLHIVGRWETGAGFNESYEVFTLPVGFRPSNEAIGFARRLGQSIFEVYVQPDGIFYDSDGWADFIGTRDVNVIVPLD